MQGLASSLKLLEAWIASPKIVLGLCAPQASMDIKRVPAPLPACFANNLPL